MTFSSGEAILSTWMAAHASVCWMVTPSPWLLEQFVMEQLALPLNLDQNKPGAFHFELSAARARQREAARSHSILTH